MKKDVGLKVGLEIHQQLEGKKLFCECPTDIIDDKPDLKIKRNLRAAAGETGEIDQAAKHEQLKEKHYLYHFYDKANCLVEIDEEPPHPVNKEALEVCLLVAKMLNAKVIDEIVFMRKTVVDGSNVSGFQRTGLIAIGGYLETKHGKVTIPTICLEEDSAKIVEKTSDYDVYNLSRLGIPLVEIATGPDIHSPEQAKEVAEKLGMILRSTGKVKRGLGTIRQDINISIKGGKRIEIKGAQDLKLVSAFVENEIKRQQTLIDIAKKLGKLNLKNEKHDLCSLFKKVECKITQNTLKNKGVVYGIKLNGFGGILGMETQPGKRFGTELSDYGKVKAGVGGLFHSDELPKYGITANDVSEIRKKLGCTAKDAFVLVADKKDKVIRALDAVFERARLVHEGVIMEVRNPNADGTSSYLRPMPGADRMYPETDIPTTPVTKKYLDSLKLPELITDKASRLKDYGLSQDLADLLAKKGKVEQFESFVKTYKLKPAFIAETMLPKLLFIKRKHNLTEEQFNNMKQNLNLVFQGVMQVGAGALDELLLGAADNNIDLTKFEGVSAKELEDEIKKLISENKNANFGMLMGKVMGKFKGKVDGKKVSEILKKYLK